MSSLFGTTSNLSFYAVPAAWVLAISPRAYSMALSKDFDGRFPRDHSQKIANDQSFDKATKGRIQRAEAAQANGFENLGLFAAAVVAGNIAGLSAQTLNTLTATYLASRVIYTFIYVTNTTRTMANVRTLVFLFGVGQIFTLFIKSGNALRNSAANLL